MPRRLRIEQVRSVTGVPETQRRTLRSLGLRHREHSVVRDDVPSIRGMIDKVSHLVEVDEVEANGDDG